MRRLALLLSLLALAPAARAAYPDRPITLATGFGPGGSTDIAARLLADRLGATLPGGARVLVENRPGAGAQIASDWLRRQPADGYTLMLIEASSHAVAPAALPGGTRYDPVADYTQVGIVGVGAMVLIVPPAFPGGDSAAATVAAIRAAPRDSLSYSSSGVGSINHIAAELFRARLGPGVAFTHVPYRSGGLMTEAVAAGEVGFGFAVMASAAGQIRDGRVRGVAVGGLARTAAFPDLPPLNESAVPGYDIGTWTVVVAPRGLPAAELMVLNRALNAAIAEPALRARLLVAGIDAAAPNTPAEARAFVAAELAKFRDIVARTGVVLEP